MLTCQRHLFNLPDNVRYLNTAYMSANLRSVTEAGIAMVQCKEHPWEITPENFTKPVRELRGLFAKLINTQASHVAIVPSASYGMAVVARNVELKVNETVVTIENGFPSSYHTWRRACAESGAELIVVGPGDGAEDRTTSWNARLLEAIDERCKLVSIAHVHWSDGTRYDLEAIRKRCDETNTLLIVDGTQSIGALPFDVQKIRPDAVACAGYKWLCGGYTLGFLYLDEAFHDGKPLEENWLNRRGSEDFTTLSDYVAEYHPGAGRFSMGEQSNFVGVAMARAAIEQLLEWDVAEIQKYVSQLMIPFWGRLVAAGIRIPNADLRSAHLFGLELPDSIDTVTLKERLAAENIYVSYRGKFMRISLHINTREEDVEALVSILEELA